MNSSWGYDWSAAFNIYAAVPTDGSGAVETGFLNRPTVAKKSGAVVGARLFCEPQSSGVSGVLFSDIGIWNAPREIGTDLIFVHNPMAAVPLPVGVFGFATEYHVGPGGKLCTKQRG
ncbi:MAG: hypothetical protein IPI67_17920 [Myxococcales bacterium]|nr:hypothetical protein [Myxococcales bacterium]